MPERTVKVNLVAQVNGYVAGMEAAARKTRDLGSEAEKLAAKRQAFEDLGRPLLAFGAIAAAAVGVAIKKFADFDAAISNVSAVTQETTENMGLLRDAALDAGGATVFTATEAANAIEELGKAGLSTADILGGALDGALSLAASGQLEVARAAEITATTLKQFNLAGSEAGHVADVLSAGAGKALGSVEDLAEGLKYVGPVARSMGISLEETVGALALFADQGLIGEQAGTSLRGVLSSLTSPSKEAADKIKDLGIELYDSNGRFKGLENVAGELSDSFTTLDDKSRDAALGVIFGNQQVTAARVLFAGGAEAIHKYTTEVNDTGYAARVAADRMNNLSGDVEKLGGAFDTALIKSGSGANDTLRELVQGLTFLVDGVGNVPEPVLNVGLAIGAVTAAMALTGGAALVAVPRVVAFKTALENTKIGAKGAALAVGGIGGAIGIATVLITAFAGAQAEESAAADEFRDSLDKTTGALTEYSRELIKKKLSEKGALALVEQAGVSQQELTDALYEGGDAYDAVYSKISAYANSVDGLTNQGLALRISVQNVNSEIAEGRNRFEDLAAATGDSSITMDAFSGKVESANIDLNALKDTIEGFGSAQLDVNSATRAFEAAIDDLTASIAENGQTTDVTTEAGRANQAALDAIAKSTFDLTGATLEQTGSQEAATSVMVSGRQAYIDAAVAAGYTAEQAAVLADGLGLIPSNVGIAFEVSGYDLAMQRLQNLYNQSKKLQGVGHYEGSVFVEGYASGGYTGDIPVDEVAGSVHGREFVLDASATAKPANRAAAEFMLAGGDISAYQPIAYSPAPPASQSASWAAAAPAPVRTVQQVTEHIHLDVDGRELAAVQRSYDRSLT